MPEPWFALSLKFLHRWANPWMKARTGIAPLCLGSQGDHPIQRAILLSITRYSVRSHCGLQSHLPPELHEEEEAELVVNP